MKRIKEEFLDKVEEVIKLQDKSVLEIGCGAGTRSIQIAKRCRSLIAIEPDKDLIDEALKINKASNIEYQIGSAEKLDFPDKTFDVVIFALSLHHVPTEKMNLAINEATRATKHNGFIVFLEPTNDGTFFEAEIKFDACDGDERVQKASAYNAIQKIKDSRLIAEIADETVFKFDSVEDFVKSLNPKKSILELETFLMKNNFILRAERRINIFQIM